MSLIRQIQDAAVDKDTDLATLLRKCKVLAARLGSVPLEDWVLHESNGYPDDVPVPEYRKWGTRIVGLFVDPYGRQATVTVPPHLLPEASRKYFTEFEYRRSIATAEYALAEDKDGMQRLSTGNLRSMLHDKVYENFQCHEAYAEYSKQNVVAMLDAVRNRILDFALALGKIAPDAGEVETEAVEPQRVTQIFHTTINGPVGVVGTATNSVINVTANDWAALAQLLASRGVAQVDIDELQTAVIAEPKAEAGKWGPRVSKWIGKMTAKAADGSWQIGIGAAGNLLAQVLTTYYGLQ